ncbi:MAG: alkylmercury lyase family protein [Chloroflexi bacterium]|nr:alkylmercury lyase family protein [Chloroflexota bacterium]
MSNPNTYPLPHDLAERLREVFKLPWQPQTLGELFSPSMMGPVSWDIEDLFAEAPTRHEVKMGTRRGYTHCAMDALLLPFSQDQPIELRSQSPPSGTVILVRASKDELEVSHLEAVASFGMAREGTGAMQSLLCPFINLFPSKEEYEEWAAGHQEAWTIALPVRDAFALLREMARQGP